MIGLDGFEISLAEKWMAEGGLPHLKALKDRSARYQLNHGAAKYTGLAWEHVATGKTPEALGRHSAVTFDPNTYHVSQDPTRAAPVFGQLKSRVVVFDTPYFDLQQSRSAQGAVSWGAHDPGVPPQSRPDDLYDEIRERFGPYPASEFIYAMCWQSEAATRRAVDALVRATKQRADISEWLLSERLPDWDLAMVVVSEPHSIIEPMWHGVDPTHPLHDLPSAQPAGDGVRAVYDETDALLGRLMAKFPDAAIMAFAMHGMGSNGADLPAMALLPEMLYRRSFSRPYMQTLPWRKSRPDGSPLLAEDQTWRKTMISRVPRMKAKTVRDFADAREDMGDAELLPEEIDWQPAARYRQFWPQMEAFAVPAFYDGRIRINLIGRERYGVVSRNRAPFLIDELKEQLLLMTDPATGEPAVEGFAEPPRDFFARGPSESDLYVYWRGVPQALQHPDFGVAGPIPIRRTGGHSGVYGFFYGAGLNLAVGDHGEASSFSVVPTALAHLGEDIRALGVSGGPLKAAKKNEGAIERAFA